MILVRSIAQALPGRRDDLVKAVQELATALKEYSSNARVLTASIGPADSTVIIETEHESLAQFESGLSKANSPDVMGKYMPKFSELSVPGSHRFEIYRICE
jgi:hypothetical protein